MGVHDQSPLRRAVTRCDGCGLPSSLLVYYSVKQLVVYWLAACLCSYGDKRPTRRGSRRPQASHGTRFPVQGCGASPSWGPFPLRATPGAPARGQRPLTGAEPVRTGGTAAKIPRRGGRLTAYPLFAPAALCSSSALLAISILKAVTELRRVCYIMCPSSLGAGPAAITSYSL